MTTTRPARILVVDDERENRELMEIILAREGYVVLTAVSGDQALAMVAQQPPDLVLLDVMMRGMDGYEVATRIKANPAWQHVPIVLVTALDDAESRTRGVGAEGVLRKPFGRAELSARVRDTLRAATPGDAHEA